MTATTEKLKNTMDSLCQLALRQGAEKAVLISASDIVTDERVRMKCLVPICSFYGSNLLCPPNLPSVEQLTKIVRLYKSAILVQIPGSTHPVPPEVVNGAGLDEFWKTVDPTERNGEKSNPVNGYFNELKESQEKLYGIITAIESYCLKEGYRFSMGFAAGGCLLCEKCVGLESNDPCRHPFKARPSMEAMGIDVVATAKKARIDVGFSNARNHWFGLILIE